MSLYKQPGSNIWWYEFQFDGQRIRESAKTTNKKLAEKAQQAKRREVEEDYNGIITKPKRQKTFSEAAEEYIVLCRPTLAANTMAIKERSVQHLLPFLAKKALCNITPQDIQEVVAARRASGASNRYVNMTIDMLREILRRNHQWERLRPDYKKLKEPKSVGKELSHKDEERLLHECRTSSSRVLYPVVILGLYGGMRRNEVRLLQWSQIDLEKAYLTVGKSKTEYGEGRLIPLVPIAQQALKDWSSNFPNRLPDHYVFQAEKYSFDSKRNLIKVSAQNPNKPMGSWRKAWEAGRRRAEVYLRFHDLRHTTVTRLLEAGCTLEQIAPIMGWSSSTMAEMMLRYQHRNLEMKRKTMLTLVAAPQSLRSKENTQQKKPPVAENAAKKRNVSGK